jgi:hypothetical protein
MQPNRIYKRISSGANLDQEIVEKISGYSMRVGAAQHTLTAGESLPIIMSRG